LCYMSFFVWPLCYMSFFDLRIMVTPLVSSNVFCSNRLGYCSSRTFQTCSLRKTRQMNVTILNFHLSKGVSIQLALAVSVKSKRTIMISYSYILHLLQTSVAGSLHRRLQVKTFYLDLCKISIRI